MKMLMLEPRNLESSVAGSPSDTANGTTVSALPMAALEALDAARMALLRHEREMVDRENAILQRALEAEAHIPQLEAAAEAERTQARAHIADLEAALSELRASGEALRAESEGMRAENESLQSRVTELQAALDAQQSATQSQLESQKARADAQSKKSDQLQRDLLEMHHDLMAQDAHTLILRAAMSLTGAEQGLFTDDTGEHVVASIGLDEISPEVGHALFEFTKQALRDEAPVVRNDSTNLPDNTQCVNLAALPIAVQNEAAGAILVANKRSGPFDSDDTQVLLSIGRHAGIAIQNRRLHFSLEEAYRSTIAVLADAIEAKDPYTRGHCESVSRLAVAVAQALGCVGDELDTTRYAALLHDIGKIGVSDGVLLKPGKLLPEEFGLIQKHAAIGADLVRGVPTLSQVVPLILHHHERVDGSGYPEGLEGEGIPLGARIIGAVDAFDAMTTPRPYRTPVSHEEALAELRHCAGTQFDPRVIEAFAQVLTETVAERHVEAQPIPDNVSVH